jgi:hypothetical protein
METKCHKRAIFFSNIAKFPPYIGGKLAIMAKKRILFSKIELHSLKHYLQMKIELPAGSQVYFSMLNTPRGRVDVVFAEGTCKERQSICLLSGWNRKYFLHTFECNIISMISYI